MVSLRGEQRRSPGGGPGRPPRLRVRPARAPVSPALALGPLRQRRALDGLDPARLARVPAHGLAVHGGAGRLRPLRPPDGAWPVHRPRGRSHAPRARARVHPVARPGDRARARRGVRVRARRLLAAGRPGDAVRRALGARLPGAAHRALQPGRLAPRGHRDLARDGVDAGGQDDRSGPRRAGPGAPRPRALLRGGGRALRGRPARLRGPAGAHRRPERPRRDLGGGQPGRRLPRGVASPPCARCC